MTTHPPRLWSKSWLRASGGYFLCGGLLALGGGYAFGRFSAPDKVVTKEVTRTVTVEDTHAREQVRELTAQLETMKRHTRREETRKADGSVTIVTDTHVDTTKDTRTDVDAKKEETKHTETVREVIKEKTVERARPDWRIGALGAFDFRAGALTYGALVERRVIGPVSLGAFGLTNGSVGLALTLEF